MSKIYPHLSSIENAIMFLETEVGYKNKKSKKFKDHIKTKKL